jgi:carboxypeptidase C (cathepsin A)
MSSPHPTPHSLTHSLILTLTLLTISLPSTHATPLTHSHTALSDLVTSMPGLHTNSSSLNFSMFSGFFEITSTNLLYYSLTESQGDPSEDPLVIWLNAGPGCSGMVSYMSEFGPFRVSVRTSEEDMSLTLLEHNPYSWNHFGK